MPQWIKDTRVSAIVAGWIVVLVGFTSSVALIFQAAITAGADQTQVASWISALSFATGLSTLALSWWYKMPIITAWSTPGAALLITALAPFTLAEATGAFIFSAILILLSGLTGIFARFMDLIPQSISAAMLGGILLTFGLDVFRMPLELGGLPLVLFAVWLIARRIIPKYTILLVMIVGLVWVWWQQGLPLEEVNMQISAPVWVMPSFSLQAMISVALPLFIVTMTSQNLPGVTVMRAAGYPPPTSAAMSVTGGLNLLFAPFGAFAVNLAAITAALAMSDDAHPDKHKRYTAGMWSGIFYLLVALFGATVTALFSAFPQVFIAVLAGLALVPTIAASFWSASKDGEYREAAVVTFLVTASGMSLWGIGSAFWGIVFGLLVMLITKKSAH
ncbi:benzoate/H(+) symporter BenE family transporter [Suttonella sp. R2A3]|uniref:benzoate/H(+) symporter BenE family transporter n=1 Tax=Suttonella sp. R2A3 TaxID=2908648 RepID=UPI001F1E3AD1|nr:benzoate/H(+) symporter BenE family transporter [Suttonella sp. R2A3]UJF23907.1 benzoate/H(+) symporter BenE family transporter [Suttonella sp. R2A3]